MKPLDNIWFCLLLALAGLGADGAEPKRVLFIHSFGRGFEPYHAVAGLLRTEPASQMAEPVDFFKASLESARFTSLEQESPLLEYLRAQFEGRHLDLVVPIGGPAAQFAQRHRQQLLPETPMLAAVDQRLFNPSNLTTNDAAILTASEPGLTVETLLHVLPETTNVVVVMGNTGVLTWRPLVTQANTTNPYQHLVDAARLAQKDGVIKGILLHQGESNANDKQWPNKMKSIYDSLLRDLNLKAENVPLLAGGLVPADKEGACAIMNKIIAALPKTIPTAHFVSSEGCAGRADHLHFTPAGYQELGKRYTEGMLPLLGYQKTEMK